LSHINIVLNNFEKIGFVAFAEAVQSLGAMRTASGFRLHIPAVVTFSAPSASKASLILEDLRATFIADGLEIGTAYCTSVLRTEMREQSITFSWDWLVPTLAFYENMRSGREACFLVRISGAIRFVLEGEPGKEPCSIASTFSEQGEVRYSRETWTTTLRQLNLRDTVLVEIPFPSDPPSGWEPVWQALRDARDSFDKGGSTAWRNCVASVRYALEEWRKIEKEDPGPSDFPSRTKEQRIDNIRLTLMQYANFAPHTKADEWTRDDALLAISTVSALLAARKP